MSHAYRMPSIDEYLRMQRIIDYLNDRGDRDSNEEQRPRMSRYINPTFCSSFIQEVL